MRHHDATVEAFFLVESATYKTGKVFYKNVQFFLNKKQDTKFCQDVAEKL